MCIHVATKIGKHSVLILNDIQNYQNRTYHTKYGVTISLLVKFISFFVLCVRPVCLKIKTPKHPKTNPLQKKLKPQTNKQCHKNKKELIEDQISVLTLVV